MKKENRKEQEKTTWVLEMEKKEENKDSVVKLMDLDYEHQAASEAAGQEAEVYGVWGPVWKLMNWFHRSKTSHTVQKKTYLLLLLFTGWIGGHRYYERRWILGILYTALFWTGIPLAMCIIDAMAVIPIKADENGRIKI